jgi:hypothetical protein
VRVRFARLASGEAEDIAAWYDSHEVGLGDSFRTELGAAVDIIGATPRLHAVVFAQMRRAFLHRFPYFLLYEVFATEVVVYGVIHCARDPEIWRSRGNA